MQALMSAVISDETALSGDTKIYSFVQKIPIPSYLIAIAAGNIEGKRVGPRCTIWSEPELLEASAYEFAETEDNLKSAESVLGEYVESYPVWCF
jgi:leukotriene-A4 hydrolase